MSSRFPLANLVVDIQHHRMGVKDAVSERAVEAEIDRPWSLQ